MKGTILFFFTCLSLLMFSGCAVIGGIFKAGVWVGVLAVVLVIVVVIFIIRSISGKS